MPDSRPSRSLSEISHLFLSDVRARQTGGAAMPQRTAPGGAVSIDLTPEEFDEVYGQGHPADGQRQERVRPVWAVMAGHLPGRAYDRARELARHLAAEGQRIGLIEMESSGVRLVCFEQASEETLWQDAGPASDPEAMPDLGEALQELNTDIDRWLLLVPSPRKVQWRRLMQRCTQWVLMTTCEHEGIVACYRALKGAATGPGAELLLAVVDAADAEQAERVFSKLDGVCRQFLHSSLRRGPVVQAVKCVAEHAMLFLPGEQQDSQWTTVERFLFGGGQEGSVVETQSTTDGVQDSAAAGELPMAAGARSAELPPASVEPARAKRAAIAETGDASDQEPLPEVIDLPDPCEAASLVGVVSGRLGLRLCDFRPPVHPESRVGVTADGRLVLLCAPRRGLVELALAEQAWRWLEENRTLFAMAFPALSANGGPRPLMTLLIPQEDMNHPALRTLMYNRDATIQVYRKVRFSGRIGVLLDAA